MNKGMMLPIKKQSVDKIFDGSKQFLFIKKQPKYLVKGMKVYLFENKGKLKKASSSFDIERNNQRGRKDIVVQGYYHEGQGKIVGEVTIKEIYDLETNEDFCDTNILHINGYTNQQYAIELTNVIKYDDKWLRNWFDNRPNYRDSTSEEWDLNQYVSDVPESPIPKEEFVSWNKVDKLIKNNYSKYERKAYYTKLFNEITHGLLTYEDKQCNVSSPIQSPIYVVSIDNSIE